MFLLVLAYLGCPGQSPESHKMVVVVVVAAAAAVSVYRPWKFLVIIIIRSHLDLQCFDAVGWVAGKASNL